MLLSLSAMEKIVCLITSFSVNWEITIASFFSMYGRYEKSSPDFPTILNFAFSQEITVLKEASVSIITSLSGSLRTISEKIFASSAITPRSAISPSTRVSIPSSISFAINLISFVEASIRIHSSIAIVVRVGTALDTIFTPRNKFDLEQISFMKNSLLV